MSAWRERQRLAGGDPDLLLDQVDPGDHLGDGVLDLDPGVDLDEVEVVVGVDQELAGPGVDVAGGLGQPDGGLAELGRGPSSGRVGAGASSTSFWCRRWSEQSRSQQWTTLPCESARIWTSTCRGRSMNFSR